MSFNVHSDSPLGRFSPLEWKHEFTSQPLKWMLKETRATPGPPSDAEMMMMIYVAFLTAGANLFPAWTLIQMGVRGEQVFSHVSYVRFNPWAKPIFHYTTAASRAERFGFKAAGKIGGKVGGRLIPVVGWALLAYDVYDIAVNKSLWGFDLAEPGEMSWG